MDYKLTTEDNEFARWLDSKECEHYWETDENGERVILRAGWDKAQAEYNRIKGSFVVNLEKDLKECGTLYHRE